MPRVCNVCRHPEASEINLALLTGSFRDIAGRYGLSSSALERHKKHLPSELVKSEEARKISNADDLMAHAQRLLDDAERMGKKAEGDGLLRVALLAIGEQRNVLKLFGEVMGEIRTNQTIHTPDITQIIVDL